MAGNDFILRFKKCIKSFSNEAAYIVQQDTISKFSADKQIARRARSLSSVVAAEAEAFL